MELSCQKGVYFAILWAALAPLTSQKVVSVVPGPAWAPSLPRQLVSPVYDSIAYNNYVNYMGTYGGNPWSFTPYASMYVNPFSNPSFAENFPQALQQTTFGPQMLNYLTYMNPMLYGPTGAGDTWNVGEFGLGSAQPRQGQQLKSKLVH